MCQLLGMNCAQPTDITFSFAGFSARGGLTDHHADGFGIAFFEQKACRLFIDNQRACASPIAQLIKNYPIKSKNIIAHIRKATQGEVLLENSHPFMRELWGRHWIFAHNGDLKNFTPELNGRYQPVGNTDSEYAFCYLLQSLHQRFGAQAPELPTLFVAVQEISGELMRFGSCNFLLSNGQALIAHASTQLYYLIRQWPFSKAHLVDEDMDIDFSTVTTPEDRVAVIATQPLTDNEHWQAFDPGDLVMFKDGKIAHQAHSPISMAE